MDSNGIKAIVEQALRDPQNFPWFAWIVVVTVAALGSFFGSYLWRKAHNLATKEDIAELTEQVERVRSQHAERLENLAHENRKALENTSREHQLRLAALDRRLDTHQQAFTLCEKLISAMHTDKVGGVVSECQSWWQNNCLYLDAQARDAFFHAYHAAHIHESLLRGLSSGQSPETIKENWAKIVTAGNVIAQGVALPPIKELVIDGKSANAFGNQSQRE
jgi:hypothetical protein